MSASARQLDSAIKVEGLNHSFGVGDARKQVLHKNCLDIKRGEIVIMTGPSGSGKTTLLTLIGTLRKVQDGSLQVLGQELNGIDVRATIELRKQIGFIFQAHNLFESLTAFQNVKMAAELVRMPEDRTKTEIEGLLTRLGLGDRIHYKPKSLSGGQKQRVAVARGLVHQPQLILADEPTAALDEQSGREAVTIFQELAREHGRTILMVTHDNRILDVADRIVNMVDGHIRSNVVVAESALICEFLHGFPIFAELTPNTLADVADSMVAVQFPAGSTLIRQGDIGDLFYVIRDGSVDVIVEDETGERVVDQLAAGDYFGEVALMTDQPRNATIRALEETTCYTLSKDKFRAIIDASASFREELRKAIFARQ